nr:winged helix-turn-helix domain-containing protein [Cryptomonas curvata]
MVIEIKKKSVSFITYVNLVNVFQKNYLNQIIQNNEINNFEKKILFKKLFYNSSVEKRKKDGDQLLKKQLFILNLILFEHIKKDIFIYKLKNWNFFFKFFKKYVFFCLCLKKIYIMYNYFLILINSFSWIFLKQIFIIVQLNFTKLINYNFIIKNTKNLRHFNTVHFYKKDLEKIFSLTNSVNLSYKPDKFYNLHIFFYIVFVKVINIRIIQKKLSNNLNCILNTVIKNKKILYRCVNL